MANTRTTRSVLLTLACSALLLSGCDAPQPAESAAPDPLVERLAQMGFRRDMIQDQGSHFLVEGDIIFDKGSLRAQSPATTAPLSPGSGPRRQWSTTYTVSGGIRDRQIRVYLSSTLRNSHPSWATATREAMTHWNSVPGFNLRFVEVTSSSATDITVSTYSNTSSYTIASASAPSSSGQPGSTVSINVGFRYGYGVNGQPTQSSRVYNMVHEFGHTIGFRHTNWQARGETTALGANLVNHTPETDPYSVMNGGTANNDWYGFSNDDLVAARVLYTGYLRADGAIAPDSRPVVTWQAVPGVSHYIVGQHISSFPFESAYELGTTTDTSFTLEYGTVSGWHRCAMFEANGVFVLAVFPEGTTTQAEYSTNVCFEYN
jgi:hypothetical protein